MAFSRPALCLATGLCLTLALGVAAPVAHAQPADATVLRDLRGPGQVSLRLLPAHNRPEQIAPDQWEFLRGAVIVRHSDVPDIDLEITGQAQYHSSNGRTWRYVTFLVTENRYLGIPDPSPAEIDALIAAHPAALVEGAAPSVLGLPTSGPTLAPDATFTWYTPNSVSFPMVVEFERVVAEGATIRVDHLRERIDVRLYRDAPTQPWASYGGSLVGEAEVLGTRELPRSIRQCATSLADIDRGVSPVRSLASCIAEADGVAAALAARAGSAEERASFRVTATTTLPVTASPLRFVDARPAIQSVHDALSSLGRSELEAFLRSTLAQRYFASPGVLDDAGIELVSLALFEVFSAHGSYRTQICRTIRYDPSHSSPNAMMMVGMVEGVTALIQVEHVGDAFVIGRLEIHVRHDEDGVALAARTPCAP